MKYLYTRADRKTHIGRKTHFTAALFLCSMCLGVSGGVKLGAVPFENEGNNAAGELSLAHAGVYEPERQRFRFELENEQIRCSLVTAFEEGEHTGTGEESGSVAVNKPEIFGAGSRKLSDVYATFVFPRVTIGMINPDGFLFISRTPGFAGTTAAYKYGEPRFAADHSFEPVERRGAVIDLSGPLLLFWLRRKDFSETGAVYSRLLHAGDKENSGHSGGVPLELDLGLGINQYFSEESRGLSADRRRIGGRTQVLRTYTALRAEFGEWGKIGILASMSAHPTLSPAAFVGLSTAVEFPWIVFRVSGDYTASGYILSDGDRSGGGKAFAAEMEIGPEFPVELLFFGELRDKGPDILPHLYRETEYSSGGDFSVDFGELLQLDAGVQWDWKWNAEGEGERERTTEASLEYPGELLKVKLEYTEERLETSNQELALRRKGEGNFKFSYGILRLEAEALYTLDTDMFDYSIRFGIDTGEHAEGYMEFEQEDEEWKWSLGWSLEAAIPEE